MRDFASLFAGRDDAFGWYGPLNNAPSDRGKRTGQAATRRGAVTPDMYAAHLRGEQRLGIVPVLKDGTCWWACIDVDFYQEHGLHEDIAARIKELSLPLVQSKSKSGGVHLWCFFEHPVKAADAISMMEKWRKRLRLPVEHIDIFPAQEKTDDIGNWVNLPYYGDVAHGVGDTGDQDLSLEDFLAYANDRIQHSADLRVKAKDTRPVNRSDAPPCIDYMRENGVPEGYRDNALTQFAVYMKKRGDGDWKLKIQDFNQEFIDPPLTRPEVSSKIRSVQGKEYGYLCSKIKPLYCDLKECKLREFGVGDSPEIEILIDRLEKIDGEEPIYRVTIDGKRFQVTLDQLFHYNAFKKIALGAINRFLPMLKQAEWEEFMKDKLAQMEIEEAAADTQNRDRIIRIFQRFAENATTESIEDAFSRGIPYYDSKHIIFHGDEFLTLIDRQIARLPREKTWAYMRDAGCVIVERTIDERKVKFWCYVPDGPLWFDPEKGQQK
jgi:hypothetical protein